MGSIPTIPEQFTGYAAFEQQRDTFDLKPYSYTPRPFTDEDVDVKIQASGICGSDIHVLRSGWGKSSYPAIVGHEIVGEVVRAGKNSGHVVGERVGFGAQCDSCGQCIACGDHLENYCKKKWTGTYQGALGKHGYTQGGYADYYRGPGSFAITVPEGLPSDIAASLYCAGVTVYQPLRSYGAGPGKKVAIVGLGGLGHLGVQFAKALGAETYVLSHSPSKKADAEAMGADGFIVTKDIASAVEKYTQFFDIILCTSYQDDMPLNELFFPLLRPMGHLVIVGLPETNLPSLRPQSLFGKSLTGSLVGSPRDIEEMLQVAVKHNVRPWIETRPMADVAKTVQDMHEGKARYRYVLLNPGTKASKL